jgi:HK97 gp10 family phage protein
MPSVSRSFTGHAGANFSFVTKNTTNAINKMLTFSSRIMEPALFVGVKKALLIVERKSVLLITGFRYYKNPINTGHMRRAITSRVLYQTHREIAGVVGVANTYYAIYVHEGTYKMVKRPFLTDAAESSKEEIINAFRGIIKAAVKTGTKGGTR